MSVVDLLLKKHGNLKLPFNKRDSKKIKTCTQFSKNGCCSFGPYCRYNHPPKKSFRKSETETVPDNETYDADSLLNCTETILLVCNTFKCASCKIVDVGVDLIELISKVFQDSLACNGGAMLVFHEHILPALKSLFLDQISYFRLLSDKDVASMNKKDDFYIETLHSARCIESCEAAISQIEADTLSYLSAQSKLYSDLMTSTQSNPALLSSLNLEIDEYYNKVTAAMSNAANSNFKIIKTLTDACTKFFKKFGIFPNIVPFGSAANNLGSTEHSDLDLSLSLFNISDGSETVIENDNNVRKVRVRLGRDGKPINATKSSVDGVASTTETPAVATKPTKPGLKMSGVLRQIVQALNYSAKGVFEIKEIITRARVPIIKLRHIVMNIDVDICINNRLAVKNTQLLYSYTKYDVRAHKLMLSVKLWAAKRGINNARNSTLSSYGWVLTVIYFLQQCGILPSFRVFNKVQGSAIHAFDFELLPLPSGTIAGGNDSGGRSGSDVSVAELLIQYFAFFGIQNSDHYYSDAAGTSVMPSFNIAHNIISIRPNNNCNTTSANGTDSSNNSTSSSSNPCHHCFEKASPAGMKLITQTRRQQSEGTGGGDVGGGGENDDVNAGADGDGGGVDDNDNENDDDHHDDDDDDEEEEEDGGIGGVDDEEVDDAETNDNKDTPITAGSASTTATSDATLTALHSVDLWYKFSIQDPFEEYDLGRVIKHTEAYSYMILELSRAVRIFLSAASAATTGQTAKNVFVTLTAKNTTLPCYIEACYLCSQKGHFAEFCTNMVCRECGERGHLAKDCPKKTCHICGLIGHISAVCPNRRSYGRNGNNNQYDRSIYNSNGNGNGLNGNVNNGDINGNLDRVVRGNAHFNPPLPPPPPLVQRNARHHPLPLAPTLPQYPAVHVGHPHMPHPLLVQNHQHHQHEQHQQQSGGGYQRYPPRTHQHTHVPHSHSQPVQLDTRQIVYKSPEKSLRGGPGGNHIGGGGGVAAGGVGGGMIFNPQTSAPQYVAREPQQQQKEQPPQQPQLSNRAARRAEKQPKVTEVGAAQPVEAQPKQQPKQPMHQKQQKQQIQTKHQTQQPQPLLHREIPAGATVVSLTDLERSLSAPLSAARTSKADNKAAKVMNPTVVDAGVGGSAGGSGAADSSGSGVGHTKKTQQQRQHKPKQHKKQQGSGVADVQTGLSQLSVGDV